MNLRKYSPRGEVQRVNNLDTLGCVSFSACNTLEMRLNYLISKKLIPERSYNFLRDEGYLKNKLVNFSDRWLAKKSKTTRKGNYLYKVANAVQKHGLVPESDYPMPEDPNWQEYYQKISDEELEAKAKRFKKHFDITWQWANRSHWERILKEQKKPIQVSVYAWVRNENKYNNKYYRPEGRDFNHAVVKYRKGNWIFDTYRPFFKELTENNFNEWGIVFNIKFKNKIQNMDIDKFLKKNDKKIVRNIKTGAYAVIYDGKFLHIAKDRAGLFTLDREARGMIGKKKAVQMNDKEWKQLDQDKLKF